MTQENEEGMFFDSFMIDTLSLEIGDIRNLTVDNA
jgi:hypothetical protein